MKRLITICLILLLLTPGYRPPPVDASSPPAAVRVALAGRLGGASLAVAAQGAYAFVGQSAEFTVLDMADRTRPRRVAYLPLAANDIVLDGGYAYVSNKHGLAAIDVEHPTAPAEIGFLALPDALNGLAVENGYVYASAPKTGLYVIDHADPSRLLRAGFLRLPQIEGVSVRDGYVYLATAQGLKIVSVDDPGHPVLVGALAAPAYAEAIVVAGQYAYLTAAIGSLSIVDIAEPTRPRLVGAVAIPTFTKNLQVMGDIAYVANGNRGVALVDVANRRRPQLLGVYMIGALVTDVTTAGDTLLATDVSDGGLYILDAAHPGQLDEVGVYRAPGSALDVAAQGNYAYVASGLEGDITVVNQADPANPVGVGFQRTPDMTTAVQVNNGRLFAYNAQAGLRVFDLSEPGQPAELGVYDLVEKGRIVAMQGALSFVSDRAGALHVFDASLTDAPSKVGRFPIAGTVQDAAVSSNFLLVANGVHGVTVINHAGRTESASLISIVVPGDVQFIDATRDDGYVLTSDGALSVLDLSVSDAPRLAGQVALETSPRALFVHGRYAFVAAGEDGVFIVDIAEPSRPVLVAVYDTPGVALNVESVGDNILVADGYAGLLILALNGKDGDLVRRTPSQGREQLVFPTPG